MKPNTNSRYARLAVLAMLGMTASQAFGQITLTPDLKVTPDTSKPGFVWRIFGNSANQANSNQRTEDALAGRLVGADGSALPNLADPAAQGVAIAAGKAPSPANAPITFEIDSVINLNQAGGGAAGNFPDDGQMPGVPLTDGAADGMAAEILTYIELPAGKITMGVNSDDGFLTSAGSNDVFARKILGQFEGGRGASDTLFSFTVQEAGVYAFRTIYEEGGGDSNIEWFTVKDDGTKILVNDVAAGGVKAYRARQAGAEDLPAIVGATPTPAPRQANKVSSSVTITLADGSAKKIDDNSISLQIDGKAATVKKTRNGSQVTISYTPDGLQIPGDQHSASLTFKDASGAYSRTADWKFYGLKNIVLPAPKILETFDTYPEDSQPTGWKATNFTSHCADGRDINDQGSESYENWVLVNVDHIASIDGGRPYNIAPGQLYNGKEIKNQNPNDNPFPAGAGFPEWLMTGNVLYAESDSRCNSDSAGGTNEGQTQFIETKAFDLSGFKQGVVLTFSSIYEQNQDSMGAMEYSVDAGKTWLPVVYFLDDPDIKLNADGTVDAVKTFKDENTDTSNWVDAAGNPKGNNYGDGIAAVISQDLANYIVPRVNDDQVEGKRVEIFRLPAALGKADVRLRLSAMGTDSWYFAVDNIALYDVASSATPPTGTTPTLAISSTGGKITITYTGTLQSADAVSGPYTDVAGSASPLAITPSGAAKFYRAR